MLVGLAPRAGAQTTVTISVDATAAGTPLERVWPYHGYDEVNYSTTTDGKALLKTLAAAHTRAGHVRTHFLLNTGNGTASLKWGSTNAYTEDAAGNPVYSWTLMDGIMDAITGAGAFPLAEIAFMPQALSTDAERPTWTPASGRSTAAASTRPRTTRSGAGSSRPGRPTKTPATRTSRAPGCGSCGTSPTSATGTARSPSTRSSTTTPRRRVHEVLPNAPLGGPAVASATGTFLTQFLQHCATGANAVSGETGARLDLVSFHAKGGVGDHRRPRRDEPRQPAAPAPERDERGGRRGGVQADADLHHRGRPGRLRRLSGQHDARRRLPELARLRRVRGGDDEADDRARGADRRQARRRC